jgi:autotransporter translocation and assembly factor TamB
MIRGDSADFAAVEAIMPSLLGDAKGRLAVALALGGTWVHPTLDGRVRVKDGEVLVKDAGITLHGITADLRMFGPRDSVSIDTLRAWSGKSPADYVSVSGFLRTADRQNPTMNFHLEARNFRALDKRSLARLDISTGPGGLTLTGPEEKATLTGSLHVDHAVVYMPDQALAKKQLVHLSLEDVDTTDVRLRAVFPSPPSKLVENLSLGGVSITLGDDVSLQSQEADIKLVGFLNVTRAKDSRPVGRAALLRQAADTGPVYRLALDGTLTAVRGRYTVDLGVWQRDFQVEGGTITFYGTPDFNPAINISALYNVRQYNRPDIRVRVRVSGYLYPQPTLSLESGESFDISQSDLVSYLCCGAPNFELAGNQGPARAAAQLLLPTASSILTRALRNSFGASGVNLQFQVGATDNSGANSNSTARDFFAGSRLGGETQVTNNLYFSFSAGLCQFEATGNDPGKASFVDQLAGKLQYRVTPTFSVEGGREPPASALVCGPLFRGFIPTPAQWGIMFNKSWLFR